MIAHVRNNIRKENFKKGIFDLEGVISFLCVYLKILRHLIFSNVRIVYLLLSSGWVGFMRDAVIIFTASLFTKVVVAHYRGGNFHNFYRECTPWYKRLIKSTIVRIDTIIVLANNLKFMFKGLIEPERIRVLYNGLPPEEYFSIKRNIDKDSVTIFFMGHLTFPKGFYDLIHAYKRLKDNHSHIRLVFAGGLPKAKPRLHKALLANSHKEYFLNNINKIKNETLSFIENSSLYDAHYLGFVSGEEKKRAFSDADIFVFPSYNEGFPTAVLEAMASGLPVVVTPVGALPEVLEDGVGGFFVRIGDLDDLIRKIEILITDAKLRKKIGLANKAYVSQKFDIRIIAKELATILREAMETAS